MIIVSSAPTLATTVLFFFLVVGPKMEFYNLFTHVPRRQSEAGLPNKETAVTQGSTIKSVSDKVFELCSDQTCFVFEEAPDILSG